MVVESKYLDEALNLENKFSNITEGEERIEFLTTVAEEVDLAVLQVLFELIAEYHVVEAFVGSNGVLGSYRLKCEEEDARTR